MGQELMGGASQFVDQSASLISPQFSISALGFSPQREEDGLLDQVPPGRAGPTPAVATVTWSHKVPVFFSVGPDLLEAVQSGQLWVEFTCCPAS